MRSTTTIVGSDLPGKILKAARLPPEQPNEGNASYPLAVGAGSATLFAGATMATPGPWVELYAAGTFAVAMVLKRILLLNGNGWVNKVSTLELGYGAAGSENVIGQFRVLGSSGGDADYRLPFGLVIPAGSRLAGRLYDPGTSSVGLKIRNLIMVQLLTGNA